MSGNSEPGKSSFSELEALLGHTFEDHDRLRRALTHASADSHSGANAYERLEFLGDRVLGLAMAECLLKRFPDEREGEIARRHASLVSRDALAEVARAMGLSQFLVIGQASGATGRGGFDTILADVMEALLAALYLDGGLETARQFILDAWEPLIAADRKPPREPKTGLQEWAQGRGLPLPSYETTEQSGPSHAPEFTVRVTVSGHEPEEAFGPSKRRAEQSAAEMLLKRLEGGSDA
ncbi:MAG: ribonuclease III [Rhodospirillaceae bacterium]|nr:ribonuclease III [Rhodospirillaceae bacterium]